MPKAYNGNLLLIPELFIGLLLFFVLVFLGYQIAVPFMAKMASVTSSTYVANGMINSMAAVSDMTVWVPIAVAVIVVAIIGYVLVKAGS